MANGLNKFTIFKIKNKQKVILALKSAALIPVSFYEPYCIAIITLIYYEKCGWKQHRDANLSVRSIRKNITIASI